MHKLLGHISKMVDNWEELPIPPLQVLLQHLLQPLFALFVLLLVIQVLGETKVKNMAHFKQINMTAIMAMARQTSLELPFMQLPPRSLPNFLRPWLLEVSFLKTCLLEIANFLKPCLLEIVNFPKLLLLAAATSAVALPFLTFLNLLAMSNFLKPPSVTANFLKLLLLVTVNSPMPLQLLANSLKLPLLAANFLKLLLLAVVNSPKPPLPLLTFPEPPLPLLVVNSLKLPLLLLTFLDLPLFPELPLLAATNFLKLLLALLLLQLLLLLLLLLLMLRKPLLALLVFQLLLLLLLLLPKPLLPLLIQALSLPQQKHTKTSAQDQGLETKASTQDQVPETVRIKEV